MHLSSLALLLLWPVVGPVALQPTPHPPTAREPVVVAAAALHGWDARRERAWATQDARALRALYAPRSGAAAADVRLMGEYAARRLVVRRIVTQVLDLQVLHLDARRVRIRVLDRVAGGVVAGRGTTRPLGRTPPTARVVELRRLEGAWRVVSVNGWGRDPRGARR